MKMKFGFIGAGKVGCSLGKYLVDHNREVAGYYDTEERFAAEAAEFTDSSAYTDVERLTADCDVLFLTVPDSLISSVWEQIKKLPVEGKFLCHCSGSLSVEDTFAGIRDRGAFGYSIHPLFAVSDRFHSYKELDSASITIEGDSEHLNEVAAFFAGLGNEVRTIRGEDKTRYHLAAVFASNLVCGLIDESLSLMEECGFTEKAARKALAPLILGNVNHIVKDGVAESLTGPVERGDRKTLARHLSVIEGEDAQIYRLLSRRLARIASVKHPDRDYSEIKEL